MVILAMNCYQNLGSVGVMDLLLCKRDFLNVSFSANKLGLSLKSNAVCVCIHPLCF